jgi:AraC-like DNA-binding protein
MLHLEHTQWVQNVMTVQLVRQFAGPHWAPTTIAFEARYTPGIETQSQWPNTRFLSAQQSSWIDVSIELLSLPNPAKAVRPDPSRDWFQPINTDTVSMLRLLLPSYLDERVPNIAEVAEIVGTSVRTLQRELAAVGLTYSGLIDQARFGKAVSLLRAADAKIIDVAFATGTQILLTLPALSAALPESPRVNFAKIRMCTSERLLRAPNLILRITGVIRQFGAKWQFSLARLL